MGESFQLLDLLFNEFGEMDVSMGVGGLLCLEVGVQLDESPLDVLVDGEVVCG